MSVARVRPRHGKIGLHPHGAAVRADETGLERQGFLLAGQQGFDPLAGAVGMVGVAEVEQIARAQGLGFVPGQRAKRTVHVEEATFRRAQTDSDRRMFDRCLVQMVILKHGDAVSRMRQSRGVPGLEPAVSPVRAVWLHSAGGWRLASYPMPVSWAAQ